MKNISALISYENYSFLALISIGKQIVKYGFCVMVDHSKDEENYYYGIIKNIMQLECIGEQIKQLVLFNYQWFDCKRNNGVKVHKVVKGI